MHEYINLFREILTQKYATFDGRASRREFWTFHLISIVVLFGLQILGSVFLAAIMFPLALILSLALFIPITALSIRRLHDIDKSGWMMLINLIPFVGGIIMLILYATKGTEGPNRFGPDPYDGITTIEEGEDITSPFEPN